ncbi:MAG TPA: universal stress protein [Hyphomicrobiaceae bacterium]|nr:universal stress protein [Hyphomicrobiaceae bacterium]
MKSILVPIEEHEGMRLPLLAAKEFAEHHGSTVSGMALRAPRFQVVGAEPVVAVSFPVTEEDEAETLSASQKLFDTFVTTENATSGGAKFVWNNDGPLDDVALGSVSRVYDITVIGRPNSVQGLPRMTTLEAALFDSGRPVLIIPPEFKSGFGKNVVISWNCSTESSHTIATCLPILKLADKVTVLTVPEAMVPGPSGAQLCDYLKFHDINADEVTAPPTGRKPGAAILEETAKIGGDLLIKGAYTQSRLRQMILGGATSYLLSYSTLPIFMEH